MQRTLAFLVVLGTPAFPVGAHAASSFSPVGDEVRVASNGPRVVAVWSRQGPRRVMATVGGAGRFPAAVRLSPVPGRAGQSAVAISPGGRALAAWTRRVAPGKLALEGADLGRRGTRFGPAFTLRRGRGCDDATTAVNDTGAAGVAWTCRDSRGVVVEVTTRRGTGRPFRRAQSFAVAPQTTSFTDPPRVVIDARGTVTVAFSREGAPDRFRAVVLASGRAGEALDPPQEIPGSFIAERPQLAIDDAGTVTVAWLGVTAQTSAARLVHVATRPRGGALAPATIIAGGPAEAGFFDSIDDFQLLGNRAGAAAVIWRTTRGQPASVRVGVTRRPAGGSFGTPLPLSDRHFVLYTSPAVIDGRGRVALRWDEVDDGRDARRPDGRPLALRRGPAASRRRGRPDRRRRHRRHRHAHPRRPVLPRRLPGELPVSRPTGRLAGAVGTTRGPVSRAPRSCEEVVLRRSGR